MKGAIVGSTVREPKWSRGIINGHCRLINRVLPVHGTVWSPHSIGKGNRQARTNPTRDRPALAGQGRVERNAELLARSYYGIVWSHVWS